MVEIFPNIVLNNKPISKDSFNTPPNEQKAVDLR